MDNNQNDQQIQVVGSFLTSKKVIWLGLILTIFFIASILLFLNIKRLQKQAPNNSSLESKQPPLKESSNSVSNFPLFPYSAVSNKTTTEWNILKNINGFEIKYPPFAKVFSNVQQIDDIKTSSSVYILLDPTKKASEQKIIGISVLNNTAFNLQNISLKQILALDYRHNATSSATLRMITKPISILYFDNPGYEYYIQSSGYDGIGGKFQTLEGENRIAIFEKGDKVFIIFHSLNNDQINQIMGTLNVPTDL